MNSHILYNMRKYLLGDERKNSKLLNENGFSTKCNPWGKHVIWGEDNVTVPFRQESKSATLPTDLLSRLTGIRTNSNSLKWIGEERDDSILANRGGLKVVWNPATRSHIRSLIKYLTPKPTTQSWSLRAQYPFSLLLRKAPQATTPMFLHKREYM